MSTSEAGRAEAPRGKPSKASTPRKSLQTKNHQDVGGSETKFPPPPALVTINLIVQTNVPRHRRHRHGGGGSRAACESFPTFSLEEAG